MALYYFHSPGVSAIHHCFTALSVVTKIFANFLIESGTCFFLLL